MPTPISVVLFSLLAFSLSLAATWFETQSIRAVFAWEEGDPCARERAARSDLMTWTMGVIALVTAVEVGWWVLVPEGLGIYLGTKLAMRGCARQANQDDRAVLVQDSK